MTSRYQALNLNAMFPWNRKMADNQEETLRRTLEDLHEPDRSSESRWKPPLDRVVESLMELEQHTPGLVRSLRAWLGEREGNNATAGDHAENAQTRDVLRRCWKWEELMIPGMDRLETLRGYPGRLRVELRRRLEETERERRPR